MSTGAQIAENVLAIVQDDGFEDTDALRLFNQCAGLLSRKFILPSLDQQGTVLTSETQWSVNAPDDYQRNLYEAIDSKGRPINIFDNRKQMIAYSGGDISKTGTRVERIAMVGSTLLHWPVSASAEELTLFYQRKPTEITLEDEIDLFPESFADGDMLLENFACWKMFQAIEQGLEGAKVDTQYYMALFLEMMDELKNHLNKISGVSKRGPNIVRMDRW